MNHLTNLSFYAFATYQFYLIFTYYFIILLAKWIFYFYFYLLPSSFSLFALKKKKKPFLCKRILSCLINFNLIILLFVFIVSSFLKLQARIADSRVASVQTIYRFQDGWEISLLQLYLVAFSNPPQYSSGLKYFTPFKIVFCVNVRWQLLLEFYSHTINVSNAP